MNYSASYAVLKIQPYPNRTEHVNYGIVVFRPEGGIHLEVASAPALRKVKALYPLIDLRSLKDQEESIPELVGRADAEESFELLTAISLIRDQEFNRLGRFQYSDEDGFQNQVALALQSQVELHNPKQKKRDLKSRLITDVRGRFRNLGILADSKERVPDHQVVENYSPDDDVDVQVEFALQNGLLRLAQTVDLRAATSASKNAAYSKAYSMDVASRSLEASALQTYVIVAGTEADATRKVMHTLEKTANHVLAWEDRSDMESFFTEWAAASGKPLPSLPSVN